MTTAFSWLYSPPEGHSDEGYAIIFSSKIGTEALADLEPGTSTKNILVTNFTPPGCLQVLDPAVHRALPRLDESIEPAMKISDLGLIDPNNDQSQITLRQMFGRPPRADWCYYFEKADLARQLGRWEDVARLGEHRRRTPSELIPAGENPQSPDGDRMPINARLPRPTLRRPLSR